MLILRFSNEFQRFLLITLAKPTSKRYGDVLIQNQIGGDSMRFYCRHNELMDTLAEGPRTLPAPRPHLSAPRFCPPAPPLAMVQHTRVDMVMRGLGWEQERGQELL